MIKSRCTNAVPVNKNRGETLFSTAFNTLRGSGRVYQNRIRQGAKSLLRTI